MRIARFLLSISLIASARAATPATAAPPPAVSKLVFSNITTAQASAPLPNFGQSMHILSVVFGGTATVTGLQIRLEASFDLVTWFPIMPDITQASLLGTIVYQFQTAYCPWPYLRVNSLTAPSAPATVYYTGGVTPIGPVLAVTAADRKTL